MAKSKTPSLRSRASRRAYSPSLDIDKSLTSLPRVESDAVKRDTTIVEHVNAGVTKRKPKHKAKSRAQRVRQEKGLERAEIVMDQLEKKVASSIQRAKKIEARKTDWNVLNRGNTSNPTFLQVRSTERASSSDMGGDDAVEDLIPKLAPLSQTLQDVQDSAVGQDTSIEIEEIT